MTNDDVIKMVKGGLGEATVLQERQQVLADTARPELEARHEALRALRPGDAGFDAAITALIDADRVVKAVRKVCYR